jgi:hypothetical protein
MSGASFYRITSAHNNPVQPPLSGNGRDFPWRHHAVVRETGMYVKVNDHFWQQTEPAKVTKYGHKTIFAAREKHWEFWIKTLCVSGENTVRFR